MGARAAHSAWSEVQAVQVKPKMRQGWSKRCGGRHAAQVSPTSMLRGRIDLNNVSALCRLAIRSECA